MAVKGVDLSEMNGAVDFQALKNAGVQFVILRCGYGSDFSHQDDKRFGENVAKARAAGLPLSEDVPEWFNIYNDDLFRSLLQLTREELEESYMSAKADELEKACKQLRD